MKIALGTLGTFVILVVMVVAIAYNDINLNKTDNERENFVNRDLTIVCDDKTGVEYLVYTTYDAGGITVRYTADGMIKRCGELNESN